MSGKTFKKTGRNVQVSRDDLINTTIEQLMKYDSVPPAQRSKMSNPYTDPVHTKVAGGKTVQVPRYIQHAAIVRWDILKKRAATVNGVGMKSNGAEAHTRLAKRERYSARDPYVMNRELRSVEGADDDGEDMDEFNDFPVDKELSKLREYERTRKRAVGQVNIPDERYGRGGSYGDLPRDFEIFSRRTDRGVDDTTYVRDEATAGRGQIEPKGYYDRFDPNSFAHQSAYDARAKRNVGRGGRRHMRSPSAEAREEREVQGVESDIRSEDHTAETHVENYAPVNEDEPLEYDERVDDYEGSCSSCSRGDGDGVIYRGQNRPDDVHEEHDQDDYDQDDDYDESQLDDDMDDYREYDDTDADDDERIESHDSDVECVDYTYKYLFFILLFLIIFLFVYYKRNNGTGLGI